ncbi:hypothetical protein [Candidatus Magnetaquicoccus inordinatus]|uniref:hypothetical protein n=1 Tax=Candidatus Magnetaquicoccus inordinatus TaxID=2496818 RepID=UPI00102AD750|nr:hypothetical protein [Candidatus Magnetaquicoccus inordinatus]
MQPSSPSWQEDPLEHLLASLPEEQPSGKLRKQLSALTKKSTPSMRFLCWPFGSLWQPAAVLACSAMLGLALGHYEPPPSSTMPLASGEEISFLLFGIGDEEELP